MYNGKQKLHSGYLARNKVFKKGDKMGIFWSSVLVLVFLSLLLFPIFPLFGGIMGIFAVTMVIIKIWVGDGEICEDDCDSR